MKIIIDGVLKGGTELIFTFDELGPKAPVTVRIKDEWVEVTVAELRRALRIFG